MLAVGSAADGAGKTDGGPDVVGVPADADALELVTGVRFAAEEQVTDGDEASAVAGLDAGKPAALRPADATAPASAAKGDLGSLPEVERSEPRSDTLVLSTGGAESVAGIASALAAGARVQLTDSPDPRASADVVGALAEDAPTFVVALGADLAAEDGLDWKLATAENGTELPGGGQLLFPGRMLVALYGHPGIGRARGPGGAGARREHPAARETSRSPMNRWSPPPSSPRSRSSRPWPRRRPGPTGTTPPRQRSTTCVRGSRPPVRPASTSSSTCSRAAPTSSPRRSGTSRCWRCRMSGSRSTRSGGSARPRCT